MAMSRTAFWTILLGTEPTAFRARQQETLVPTLKQLQRRHPEAVIKWFERGQLFESPDDAERVRAAAVPEKRPRDWRPGGEHRDPRARFDIPRDEKRRRFKMRLRRDRAEGGPVPPRPPGSAPRQAPGPSAARPAGAFARRSPRPRKPREE